MFFNFLKLKCYEDLNFFEKLYYKYKLSREIKKSCEFQVMMDSLLDCRSEKGFNDLLKECF